MTSGHLPPDPWVSMTTDCWLTFIVRLALTTPSKASPGSRGWDSRARHILIFLRSISTWMFSTLDGTYLLLFYTSEHRTGRSEQRPRSEFSPTSARRQSLHVDSQCGMMGNWKKEHYNVLKKDVGKHHTRNRGAKRVIFMSNQSVDKADGIFNLTWMNMRPWGMKVQQFNMLSDCVVDLRVDHSAPGCKNIRKSVHIIIYTKNANYILSAWLESINNITNQTAGVSCSHSLFIHH